MNTVVFIVVFISVANCVSIEKVGHCGRHVKRDVCQCYPQGNDDCNDLCDNDSECQGLRKCCSDGCRRFCKLPQLGSSSQQRCPPGEEYDFCGPCRQATCAQPVANRTECVSACICPPGYVRNDNGRCIQQKDCPPPLRQRCPPGEEYDSCGPRQQPTCAQPVANRTECVTTCNCPPGFVRNNDGRCIQYKDCPPPPPRVEPVCAGIHEEFHFCYRQCQGSCDNPNARGCSVGACVTGCFCRSGYVRSSAGLCILPSHCPPPIKIAPPPPSTPVCPDNEEFSTCYRECEPSCSKPLTDDCFRPCQTGCFCRKGFVRDYWGKCISLETCPKLKTTPPTCATDREIFKMCHNRCQGTCHDITAQRCSARCLTGCFCQDGYVRHQGQCIAVTECPPPKLPVVPTPSTPRCTNEYMEYNPCYQGCERTCSNPTGAGCESSQCVAGCFCRSDLVRNHLGHCVDKSQCQADCGYKEHFEECSTNCPDTCPPTTNCEDNGCQPGCVCDPGFVKNVTDGNCIPATQCRNRGGQRGGCRFGEESVPCGSNCEEGCANGMSSHSCPSSCRQRCCRRRLF